jgi:hypothetical protein
MRRPRRRTNAVAYALYANAAVLLGILVFLISGRNGPSLAPAAFAADVQPPPIAGGGSVYLMPGQFSVNQFGCYILDTDAQTLCAYRFDGDRLRLLAARSFRNDRRLESYSTIPDPAEIKGWVDAQRNGGRRDVRGNRPAGAATPENDTTTEPQEP